MSLARLELDDEIASGAFAKVSQRLQNALERLRATVGSNNSTRVAKVLEEHRALAAGLGAACDFGVTFEQSFHIRAKLLEAGVARWCVDSLQLVPWAIQNVAAVASAIRHIAANPDGRNVFGSLGGVAALLRAWKMQPSCVQVVEAFTVLCTGHIDNISRFLREDGIDFAAQQWNIVRDRVTARTPRFGHCSTSAAGSFEPDSVRSALTAGFKLGELTNLEFTLETLRLVGVCCICLPDDGKGDSLVPSLTTLLQAACRDARRGKPIAAAALEIFANIGESWAKEQLLANKESGLVPGYAIHDKVLVANSLLSAWQTWPNDRALVAAATWAFCALHRSSQVSIDGAFVEGATRGLMSEIDRQLQTCAADAGTIRALRDIIVELGCSDTQDKANSSAETISEATEPTEFIGVSNRITKKRRTRKTSKTRLECANMSPTRITDLQPSNYSLNENITQN